MVRAKFHCYSKTQSHATTWVDGKPVPGFLYDYKFGVVTADGSEENKKFFASTPSGELTLRSVRDDLFVPGEDYYLDLTQAVKND